MKPWQAVGWSRTSWYRLGKPTESRKLAELAHDIARELAAAQVATALGWRPSQRTRERIGRIARLDPELATAVLRGEISAAAAERWLLERPYLIAPDGTITPPTRRRSDRA